MSYKTKTDLVSLLSARDTLLFVLQLVQRLHEHHDELQGSVQPEKVPGAARIVPGLELDRFRRQFVFDHRLNVVVVTADLGIPPLLSQDVELGLQIGCYPATKKMKLKMKSICSQMHTG